MLKQKSEEVFDLEKLKANSLVRIRYYPYRRQFAEGIGTYWLRESGVDENECEEWLALIVSAREDKVVVCWSRNGGIAKKVIDLYECVDVPEYEIELVYGE